MTWHNFTLVVRTPMFLGAASPPKPDSPVTFPVPSLRGALRYWLRALAGTHLDDSPAGLDALADLERAVFGAAGTADEETRTASTFAVRARARVAFIPTGARPDWLDADGQVGYLLGQGLYSAPPKGAASVKGHLPAGTYIELAVRFDTRVEESAARSDLFLAALWALRTFGGLGSRARRGFGTVDLTAQPELPPGSFPGKLFKSNDFEMVQAALPAVLACVREAMIALGVPVRSRTQPRPPAPRPSPSPGGRPVPGPPRALATGQTPKYPCFRPNSHLLSDVGISTRPGADGLGAALAEVSGRLREFRVGRAGETSTEEYRTIIRPWLDQTDQQPADVFAIGALGLPVVFTDRVSSPVTAGRTVRRTATVTPRLRSEELRRASPLWLRIYLDANGAWRLRSLALLSDWLPQAARLTVRAGGSGGPSPIPLMKPTQGQVDDLLREWFSDPED